MDSNQFREFGYKAIDYVVNYIEKIRERPVLPDVQPGYLKDKIPEHVPEKGEQWEQILEDFHQIIMPGITHWQSPQFHAFFPTGSSYPSIMGEIFCAALGVVGFHWTASPACTELEVKMMDWLGKLLNLPPQFLNCSPGPGGGVIQGSASEVTFLCLLAAKAKSICRLKKLHPELNDDEIRSKLVAYTSDQANSSVEKSGILGSIKMRILKTDDDGILTRQTVMNAMSDDCNKGLFPCYMIATIGSTGTCISDKLNILGPICKQYNVWLHVDAAYAGAALILSEYQHCLNGIEYADSFNFNPHKWMLVNFDCSALWVQDANNLTDALVVNRVYLDDHENINTQLPEYRNWQIPLGRRFRALKLWFTLRAYGKEGLQAHIRNHISQALLFAEFVKHDHRFELVCPPRLGLVCFRLKGENQLTEELHNRLMQRKKIYMITAIVNAKLTIRFAVCSRLSTEEDIHFAWKEITSQAEQLFENHKSALNGHSENTKSSFELL